MSELRTFSGALSKIRQALRLGRAIRLAWEASPRLIAGQGLLLLLQGLVPLGALLCAKGVIDAVTKATAAGRPQALREALIWLVAAAVVAVASAAISGASSVVAEALSQEVTDHVTDTLHRRSLELDLEFYEDPAFHDKLHRAQQEAPYRPTRIVTGLAELLQHAVGVLTMAALLASWRWWMAGVLLVASIPALLARVRFSSLLFGWQKGISAAERKSWYLHELLTSSAWAAETRLLGLGPLFLRRFSEVRASIRRERLALGRRRTRADFWAQATAAAVALVASLALAKDAVTGAMSLGTFVMYFGGFQRGMFAVQAFLAGLAGLYENNLFLESLDEFLALPRRVEEPARPRPVPRPIRAGIRVEEVSFRYRTSAAPVLDGVTFHVAPEEVVALVGPNGCGKTTLVKLLLRLYDPAAGRITIDGVDLREMATAEVRRNAAVLLQDFGRYSFSARENVWFGDIDARPDSRKIEEAVRQAGAESVIGTLPRGWETVLGTTFDDGRELSTGQWQKLALARTLFRDAPFVVLDEPSASMDSLAERALFDGIRHLVAGRSALFISHRFSTVRMADRIVVLEAGRVVEDGRHDELVRQGGLYARMYEAQAGPYR